MSILLFAFFTLFISFMLIVTGRSLLTLFATRLVFRKTFENPDLPSFKRILRYGVLADGIVILLFMLYYIISFGNVYAILEALGEFTMFPDYAGIRIDGNFSTLIPIIALFVVAILVGFAIYYFTIFRKLDKLLFKNLFSAFLFAVCTAPIYYFISLHPLAYIFPISVY